MIQAGKENSQNQVLIYFVQTAIGRPDSVFIYVHNEKAGFPLVAARRWECTTSLILLRHRKRYQYSKNYWARFRA